MKKKKKNRPVTITGKYMSTSKGFGFVQTEELEDDIFIPAKYVNGAMHSDTVLVELGNPSVEDDKKREGSIVQILERGVTRVVGTYQKNQNFGFVIPDNQKLSEDIFIAKENSKGAVNGHKVVVQITEYPHHNRSAEGVITEILGHSSDPGVDILSIVESYEIRTAFPEKVMNRTERIPEEVSEADCVGREDLRSVQMVTIDGEDAKDLDDAVSIRREGEEFILGVHIADVSNYVQENSAIDKEALKRGTSVYLVDRVIPMLPHKLCNGICSLNEGVDRLALSCIMTIDLNGEVVSHRIVESVIRVDRRMTYTAVKQIIEDEDRETQETYRELVPMFMLMKELAEKLRAKRRKRGSIDFDLPETKILIDENGRPTAIQPYDRNLATKIIEDFMLIANETVASHFFWEEIPFLYRVHDTPDVDKMDRLETFIRNFGYFFKAGGEDIHPKEVQKLLAKIEGKPEEALISRLTLRSMKQARYSVACTGHFGLACRQYCHFTSPIRRYPDLQIHRIIKDEIRGRLDEERMRHYTMLLPNVADQSSKTERRAQEAENEVNKLKKVQYMEERVGQVYQGVISGITSWGIYVELPNTIEGMIRISSLAGDFYRYDEKAYELVGTATGRKYCLGEPITIIVNSTDEILRTIDFLEAPKETSEE